MLPVLGHYHHGSLQYNYAHHQPCTVPTLLYRGPGQSQPMFLVIWVYDWQCDLLRGIRRSSERSVARKAAGPNPESVFGHIQCSKRRSGYRCHGEVMPPVKHRKKESESRAIFQANSSCHDGNAVMTFTLKITVAGSTTLKNDIKAVTHSTARFFSGNKE